MKPISIFLAFILGSVAAIDVSAQALPSTVYTAPTEKVGAALAQGITQTLVRRGFAVNDPRIAQTISAVSSRAVTTAAAAGSGSSWLATAARLSPYALGGIAIYSGIRWYFNSTTGNVTLQDPTQTSTPIFSNGVQNGQVAWTMGTGYFGSPEEAFSYSIEAPTLKNYSDAQFLNISIVKNTNNTQATIGYTLKIPSNSTNTPFTKYATGQIWTSTISCPAGQGVVNNACVSAQLATSSWANQQPQSFTQQQAFDVLPQPAKDAALSPELAAETANRLWRDAAAQPDFPGVPWSLAAPTMAPDFSPYSTAHPDVWPKTKDWASSSVPTTNPIKSPDSNPNQTTAPSTSTKVDLGPDPGTPTPTLEDPPSDLFKPIMDVMKPWLSWQVPSHSGTCPTWEATPSVAGHQFHLDLSYHCTFIEQHRDLLATAAIIAWVVIAVFIILSA